MQLIKQAINNLEGDPYQILECQINQDFNLVGKKYRKLALQYHPDRNKTQEAKKKFIQICSAYQFLDDENHRKIYQQYAKHKEQTKQKMLSMSYNRKKMIDQLHQKEKQSKQFQKDLEVQLLRRKQYFNKKMQEQEEREKIRSEINKTMNAQKYYDDVSSIMVYWQKGLSFTNNLLKTALNHYGYIKSIAIEVKRNKARVIFSSIEVCSKIVQQFKHPLIQIELYLSKQKRNKLLKALKAQQNQNSIDLTLNSQTISRLKTIINRNSNLYLS